jgi:hypothetical protein
MRPILVVAALALAFLAGPAWTADIGIGVLGGISIPVANEPAEQGSQLGVRVPVNLLPLITLEPYYSRSALGDGEVTVGGVTYTRDGGEVTGFGLNALLTFGSPLFKLFPIVGLGSYRIEREAAEEISKAGYNFGLGFGVSPIPKLSLSLRGELAMVPTDETSQKFANVTVGAAYSLVSVP